MEAKRILIVDDERLVRWSLVQRLAEMNMKGIEAANAREAAEIMENEIPDLVILDVNLPDKSGTKVLEEIQKEWPEIPVIMITAYGSIDKAVTSMREGAYDFFSKPLDFEKLKKTVQNAMEAVVLKKKVEYYEQKERNQWSLDNVVAESEAMKKILNMIQTIASSGASIVLLQGESGTGKDLLAQSMHFLSCRCSKPYIVINCSSIPENLLESELFGYEKGAFTDAKSRKRGLVEMSHTGTLFLDEVGTLSPTLQAKLLRFLESHSFKRVGGLHDINVDIRVIAATNQDLKRSAEEGDFRWDLYYRLNVCPISIPPLRERRDDVLPLAQHFINLYNLKFQKNIKALSKDTEKLFLRYNWPGNVRELKNAVERSMIFETGSTITTEYLPIIKKDSVSSGNSILNGLSESVMPLKEMEKVLINNALKISRGNKSEAARLLKITRDALRYKIKKHKL
jgi:two-component system response regulator AtoC